MTPTSRLASALAALIVAATPVAAQQTADPAPLPDVASVLASTAVTVPLPDVAALSTPPASTPAATAPATPADPPAAPPATVPAEKPPAPSKVRPITMQYYRAVDQRGINVFEDPKTPGVEYNGFKVDWGAAFASSVQDITHRNSAVPVMKDGVNTNQLADIGFGFNKSNANLYLNAQVAPGIRVALTAYLSSRHHAETWVKDGYILIDESPLDMPLLTSLMKYVTVKVGHFEINYGDAHFRRTDNGNAIYNPFVGNYIMDAFTTEMGGEVYLRAKHVIAMGSITGGELHPTVLTPDKKRPTLIGKLGYDRQVNPDLRVRLTGSVYDSSRSLSNTLYGGDRAGSAYFFVLENTQATEDANFTSGQLNPGFRRQITALQVNPFVKFRGLEVFGVIEQSKGKGATDLSKRTVHQYAADVVYRLLPQDRLFAGLRYNRVNGDLSNVITDFSVNRWQASAGWFVTPGVLAKIEYINQKYDNFPTTDIRNGGRFNGLVMQGVVAF